MDNFALDELIAIFKSGILWFIVTFLVTTKELRNEAYKQFHFGAISIPGLCYTGNVIKGYQSIGRLFPQRCKIVRLDYILGYVKLFLLAAFAFILIFMMAHVAK